MEGHGGAERLYGDGGGAHQEFLGGGPAAAPGRGLQRKRDGSTIETTGKYWRPSLKSAEWNLLNREMDRGLGSGGQFIDEATKWLFVTEKGVSVFAFYGIGDGTEATPLYISRGKQAVADRARLNGYLEGKKNGTKSRRTAIDRFLKYIEDQRGDASSHLHDRAVTRDRDVPVSFGQPGGDRRGGTGQGQRDRGNHGGSLTEQGPDARYSVEDEGPAGLSLRAVEE